MLAAIVGTAVALFWFRWVRLPYAVIEADRLTVNETPVRRKVVRLSEIDRWKYRAYLDRVEFIREMRHPIEISLYPLAQRDRERLLKLLGSHLPGEVVH